MFLLDGASPVPHAPRACLLVAALTCAAAPAAADDLAVLRVALEERLSSIRTIEVDYRRWGEPTDFPTLGLITQEIPVSWCWSEGQESYWSKPVPDALPEMKWSFDGQRTVEFVYGSGQAQPRDVFVRPEGPRFDTLLSADYAFILGLRLHWAEGSLLDWVRSPSARLSWATNDAGSRVPLVEIGGTARDASPIVLRVTFDSLNSGMPQRVESTQRASVAHGADQVGQSENWRILIVEDVLTVEDNSTGKSVTLPRSVRIDDGRDEQLQYRSRFEVDRLQLNESIPASRFVLEAPFGAGVYDYSARPMHKPRHYLAGGQPALEAALKQRQEETRREVERLAASGVEFDADIPNRYRWMPWIIGFGAALLAGATFVAVRRRRA